MLRESSKTWATVLCNMSASKRPIRPSSQFGRSLCTVVLSFQTTGAKRGDEPGGQQAAGQNRGERQHGGYLAGTLGVEVEQADRVRREVDDHGSGQQRH